MNESVQILPVPASDIGTISDILSLIKNDAIEFVAFRPGIPYRVAAKYKNGSVRMGKGPTLEDAVESFRESK